MIIYNKKVVFIVLCEHVSTNNLPWFGCNVMVDYFFFWLGLLEIKTCIAIFYVLFNIIIDVYPIN